MPRNAAFPSIKDKIPPHNEDAERAALGAMLLDSEAVPAAQQYLRPEDFYSAANGRVYKAIRALYDDGGKKADIITVRDALQQAGDLEAAGGEAYIASLTNVVPTSANIEYYAQIVQDCALRRALIQAASKISAYSYDISEDSGLLLEKAQQLIFDLTDRKRTLNFRSVHETVPEAIERIEKLYHSKSAFTGVPSGFEELDRMTSGFQNAEMIVIGARPSIGKTAFALNMAANIAVHNRRPAAFFTLEMTDVALATRLISSEAHVDSNSLKTGFVRQADFQRILDAAGRIYDAPLYTVDMPNMKLLDLRTQARRLRSMKQVEIIFIDYLGLISTEDARVPRFEQVSEISRSLKGLARELNIPIVALSQIGRPSEGSRPNLASLRDSGAVEQDADVVMFLHRERKQEYKPGEGQNESIETELIIAKQRNGPVGTVTLGFRPKYTEFVNMAR
ncbi:MAG: replicative DNA helicase [Spirochaetaceae bacterium]|jgi:replicative DNA helicase|nr:replicative DNA helicase [Spirochaetaceae bacterium]